MNFLFKMYFSAFSRYGLKGAEASVIVLMAPLSLDIYFLILSCLSFFVEIRDTGGLAFVIGLAIVTISTLLYLRYRYITKEIYKEIQITYPVIYCIFGFLFFISSIVLFSLGIYIIYSDDMPQRCNFP
jgi:hypothetical protein